MKNKKGIKILNFLYPIAALGLLISLWAISAAAVGKEIIVPSLGATFSELGALLKTSSFYKAVGYTLLRSLASFGLAAVIALILSVLSLIEPVRRLLSPLIKIIRAVPTMSVILLTVVWMKPSTSPIFIAFLINFPVMYSGFYSAISSVDKNLSEMSKVYGVSKKDAVFSLYLPSVAPSAFDCMQSSISLTVKIIISAEVIAQTKNSMGVMMQISRAYLDTAQLLAWTLAAVILSYLLELGVFGLKKAVVRWK